MYSYYAAYLIGCRVGEISLVQLFICVVSSLPPPPSLPSFGASPHVRAHCAKWLFHLKSCQNVPSERISPFASSVSSSRGCAGVCHKCGAMFKRKKSGKKKIKKSQNSFVSFTSSPFLALPTPPSPNPPPSLLFSCLSQAVNTLHLRNQTRLTHRALWASATEAAKACWCQAVPPCTEPDPRCCCCRCCSPWVCSSTSPTLRVSANIHTHVHCSMVVPILNFHYRHDTDTSALNIS